MLEFETFLSRYGEVTAQAIVENLERFEGVRGNAALSLEERWRFLMQAHLQSHRHLPA
jgi:hypothetical protein